MYAIQITKDTVDFIAKFFNDGVVPKLEAGNTYFIFGDDSRPNEIITEQEFVCLHGNKMLLQHTSVYTVS